jgi:hypothetical protein
MQDGWYRSSGMYLFQSRGVRPPAVAQILLMTYWTFRSQSRVVPSSPPLASVCPCSPWHCSAPCTTRSGMRPTSPSNWNKPRARLPRAAARTAAAARQRPGQAGHVRDDRPGHLRILEASAAATLGTGSSARVHRLGQSSGRRLMLDSVRSHSGTLVAQRDDRWSHRRTRSAVLLGCHSLEVHPQGAQKGSI